MANEPLPQSYRKLLIHTILNVIPTALDCKHLVNSVRTGGWDEIVPITGSSYRSAVSLIVDTATGQGWLRDLVQELKKSFPARGEFATVLG